MKAKKEGLFKRKLWQERGKLDGMIKRIKEFLWIEIK